MIPWSLVAATPFLDGITRRRHGWDVDIPWRLVAAAPRLRRGNSVKTVARLRCRMTETEWATGVVAAQHFDAAPYLVRLDSGGECVVPVDSLDLIRTPGGGGEELSFNRGTDKMEVAATTNIALHPSASRLAIGMFHNGAAAGVLYCVDFGYVPAPEPRLVVVSGCTNGSTSSGPRTDGRC